MNQNPEVSFIICTYNRADYLDDTLSSLLEFGNPDFTYEIVVIDNNSTDNTPQTAKKFDSLASEKGIELNYYKEEKQGLSYARNRGIGEAKAKHVVFFDDDIRATKSLIPSWCSFFRQHPEATAAGGKIHVQFDAPRPKWMSHFLLPLLGHHDLGSGQKKYPSNKYPFGGNMGFDKTIFERIGLFDTDLGRKGKQLNAAEEKELFQRIRKNSIPIHYLPGAFLYHRVGRERLTIDFVRKQALGLGSSMKMQLNEASFSEFLKNWLLELGKFLATVPIGLGYLISLQGAKTKLLFQFRYWIWKGYREET
ncbi:glycosyltransferase family 2 protein [Balneolaceae bacterium YR4-1]|uniref:Glycosyltransferase family 2 protein n=1 Tax=Halalkalibaculum roseum TaxID=2709311 RepID=A0A6M1T1N6_9BACT|nr:glycosyltransferase [Halalkalibaculum roseum]NGP78026.1 glycosyltransferase family 2 protein [Halalkalibaculum roseum]